MVPIPFHKDFSLGGSLDFKNMKVKSCLVPVPDQHRKLENTSFGKYSIIREFIDVCELLEISMAYALKVHGKIVRDPVVEEFLRDVDSQDCLTVGFRVTYINATTSLRTDPTEQARKENLDATHYFSAVDCGDEMVVILKFFSSGVEKGNLEEVSRKLKKFLKQPQGNLNNETLDVLEKFATKTEEMMTRPMYKNVAFTVKYGCYSNEEGCTASLSGMVITLRNVIATYDRWINIFESTSSPNSVKKFRERILKNGSESVSAKRRDEETTPMKLSCDEDGQTVQGSSPIVLFLMNFYLLPTICKGGDDQFGNRVDLNRLFKCFKGSETATDKLRTFLEKNPSLCDQRHHETNIIKTQVKNVTADMETVLHMSMVDNTENELIEKLCGIDLTQAVDDFVENVTTRLPHGDNLEILLIGKTGAGKSSLGNSILGLDPPVFKTSDSMDSTTLTEDKSTAIVDKREITIVDTPGMCDTNVKIEGNIDAICRAITLCPNGFHALCIVFRYPMKMTSEEILTIRMLARIFGEKIIKDYVIFVFTNGDGFERQHGGKKSFKEWCYEEKNESMRSLFTQTNYRCILVNCIEKDPILRKKQTIELICTVDKMVPIAKRYTHELFEFARLEREKIIKEYKLPQLRAEIIKLLNLIINDVNRYIAKKSRTKQEKEELEARINELNERLKQNNDLPHINVLQGAIDSLKHVKFTDDDDDDDDKKTLSIFQRGRNTINDLVTTENPQVDEMVEGRVKEQVTGTCFPGISTVVLRNGSFKCMQDLEVGDEVLSRDPHSNNVLFDTVYMFGHRNPETTTHFTVLHFDNGDHNVSLSDRHMVFCVRDGQEQCLAARDVRVGDRLLSLSKRPYNHTRQMLEQSVVIDITVQNKVGIYAPFTNSGTMIVDGALVSCYVNVLSHASCHVLLTPLRQLFKKSPKTLDFVNGGKNYTDIPPWAKLALKWL